MQLIELPKLKKRYATITPSSADETLASIDELEIKKLYKKHGALLFRGFDFDPDIFQLFTKRFSNNAAFNESRGRRVIDLENNILTVNLGDVKFPLHPELSRVPWKPDVCFFACMTPPLEGGETTICDGTLLVDKLPVKLVKKLEHQKLLYQEPILPNALNYWFGTETPGDEALSKPPTNCPFTFHKSNGHIFSSFKTPFFHKTMFNKRRAFGSYLFFARGNRIRNFCTYENGTPVDDDVYEVLKNTSDKLTTAIKWQKNDVLMLDNTRFMHGRNQVLDMENRLILSYFGYLDFAEPNAKEPINVPWRTNECRAFFQAMFEC